MSRRSESKCCCYSGIKKFDGKDYALWAKYMRARLRTMENIRIDTQFLNINEEDRVFMLFYHTIDHKILKSNLHLDVSDLWKALENKYRIDECQESDTGYCCTVSEESDEENQHESVMEHSQK